MKIKLFCFLLLVTTLSCKDEKVGVCETPVSEMQWMTDQIAELENLDFDKKYSYVMTANYKGQQIFYVGNCCPNCNSVTLYYDCSGNPLADIDASQLKNATTVWISDESLCVMTF